MVEFLFNDISIATATYTNYTNAIQTFKKSQRMGEEMGIRDIILIQYQPIELSNLKFNSHKVSFTGIGDQWISPSNDVENYTTRVPANFLIG